MALKGISPQMAQTALRAFITEGSPLGPLKVMAKQIGRFFRIPIPGFRPFIVFGPEANRIGLVTERNKVSWRSTDPVTDLLQRGVLVTDGEEHQHYRRLMEPSLHPSQLPQHTQMMIEQSDRVTSTWKDGETVDMLGESRKIALLIIMQTLFSTDVWNDLPRIWGPILKAIEYISPAQTTGILFFGILPLEEVVFFFITNMLITFGMTLLLSNVSQERFARIKEQLQGWRGRPAPGPQSR